MLCIHLKVPFKSFKIFYKANRSSSLNLISTKCVTFVRVLDIYLVTVILHYFLEMFCTYVIDYMYPHFSLCWGILFVRF